VLNSNSAQEGAKFQLDLEMKKRGFGLGGFGGVCFFFWNEHDDIVMINNMGGNN
jgi:hypothetical protein